MYIGHPVRKIIWVCKAEALCAHYTREGDLSYGIKDII